MRKKAWTVRYGRVDEYINLCVVVGMDIVIEPLARRASIQSVAATRAQKLFDYGSGQKAPPSTMFPRSS